VLTLENSIKTSIVFLETPKDANVILGQSHFIKTVEDVHEALVNASPHLKFGLAFCESSGPCLVRHSGNDKDLEQHAAQNALKLSCGHSFIVFIKNGFPINVLNAIKNVPEVVSIYCATANPLQVIIAETDQGRGILGVVDGQKSRGIETEKEIDERKSFLRKIGYKL